MHMTEKRRQGHISIIKPEHFLKDHNPNITFGLKPDSVKEHILHFCNLYIVHIKAIRYGHTPLFNLNTFEITLDLTWRS